MPSRFISAITLPGGPGPLSDVIAACRHHLVHAAIFSAAVNMLNLAPTLFMLQVYDRVVPSRSGITLTLLLGVFLLAATTMSTLDFLRSSLLRRASVRLDRILAGSVLERLFDDDERIRSANAMRELDVLRQAMTGTGVLALFDAPWIPIYIAVCFLLHPWIGVLATAGGALLFALALFSERRTAGLVREAGRASAVAYNAIEASLAVASTIRALGMTRVLIDRHLQDRGRGAGLQLQAGIAAGHYVSAAKSIRLVLQSCALALGAWLAVNDRISLGAIFAASLLLGRALAPIEQITGAWNSLTKARSAWTTLSELIARSKPAEATTPMPEPKGIVTVEALVVTAPGDDERRILNKVGFELAAGEMLAIIGPNGSGKSTLARTLVGAVRPSTGAVRLDGAQLHHWPASQLVEAIGFMPQEPSLLPGSVKENIARFANGPDLEKRIVAAAQLTGAHNFILKLPQAYDTQLGPRGMTLSVGQAQRISLTRALCGFPKLLVLDEPNASLDPPGEEALIAALKEIRSRGTTVIVVAHRDRLIAEADKLLVLKEGRVAEFGLRSEIAQRLQRPMRAATASA